MEAVPRLQAPDAGAVPSDTPILPRVEARPAPAFERRQIEVVQLRPPEHRSSIRGYLFVFVGLAAASVAGWFALSEYIYG